MAIQALVPLLNVEDVEESLTFYCDVLGFEVAEQAELDGVPVWARIESGDACLMLNRPDDADSGGRAGRPSYGDVVLYMMVEDAPALHGELHGLGVSVGPLEQQDYGLHEFQLRDPDGYEIAIGSPAET